ncbi:DUF1232 domain-containing protein [Microbacteriaceae bacterium 4G12]
MSTNQNDTNLGLVLKKLLKERSLSMRKLSTLTGIDTATISRIVNGKQKVKLDHLQQFAYHLGVSTDVLYKAAGFYVDTPQEEKHSDMHTTVNTIHEILLSSDLFNEQYTIKQVEQELDKYEQYALTKEGQRIILEEFHDKVEKVNGAGPFIDQLKDMYTLFFKDGTPQKERALLGSALLYFVLSIDIIPDYVFPFGYLDDAIAVQLVLNRLSKLKQ